MSQLGDKIKQIRESKKLTQIELARRIRISNVQLSRYESNDRKPEPEMIKIIADALDVSTDYLLGRTDEASSVQMDKGPDVLEIDDPQVHIFFKDFMSAPKQKQEEMMRVWKLIQDLEKDRNPGDKQGE